MANTRKRKQSKATFLSVGLIVIVIVLVLAVGIRKTREKVEEKAEIQRRLEEKLAEETERAKELDQLEEYMKSDQYVEDTAKDKLGLTYENEIIFKETEE